MNYWESHTQVAVRFRRFDRKRYAAFRSMHKVINIGVVTASTLLFALPDTCLFLLRRECLGLWIM